MSQQIVLEKGVQPLCGILLPGTRNGNSSLFTDGLTDPVRSLHYGGF